MSVMLAVEFSEVLVDELLRDHRWLQAASRAMQIELRHRQWQAFLEALQTFETLWQQYQIRQTQCLYPYLQEHLSCDPVAAASVLDSQLEMQAVTKLVMDFMARCKFLTQVEENYLDFGLLQHEFSHISDVLLGRMRWQEQELYPLYHNDDVLDRF